MNIRTPLGTLYVSFSTNSRITRLIRVVKQTLLYRISLTPVWCWLTTRHKTHYIPQHTPYMECKCNCGKKHEIWA